MITRRLLGTLSLALVLLALAAARPAVAQVNIGRVLRVQEAALALNEGRLDDAARLLERAVAEAPADPDLRVALAIARFVQGQYDAARDSLDRALKLDSTHVEARTWLGRVQRRSGDAQGAVRTYRALLADHPTLTAIADTLARWDREDDLHSRMQQAVGVHFTVAFEGPSETALADRALSALEQAYERVGGVLNVYPVTPIQVVLYTRLQFRDITRSPAWAGGAYDGTIRVPMSGALERGAELDRVLTHEFAHALVATITTREVPQWLSEGLASALETDDVSWARTAVQDVGAPVTLEDLSGPFGGLSGGDAAVAYAASALVVRRLLDEAGGLAIAALLQDVDDGVPFEAAFAHRMPMTLKKFEDAVR